VLAWQAFVRGCSVLIGLGWTVRLDGWGLLFRLALFLLTFILKLFFLFLLQLLLSLVVFPVFFVLDAKVVSLGLDFEVVVRGYLLEFFNYLFGFDRQFFFLLPETGSLNTLLRRSKCAQSLALVLEAFKKSVVNLPSVVNVIILFVNIHFPPSFGWHYRNPVVFVRSVCRHVNDLGRSLKRSHWSPLISLYF